LSESGKKTALVTSSRRPLVERCLAPDIRAGFSAIVTAEDVSKHKPHPDPYLAGARALGLTPQNCLVLENAPAGIKSALAAGAKCLALATTLDTSHLGCAKEVFTDLFSVMRYLGWEGSE
jgi:HAD superfamily hydrolase (TIGR01509 family)